MIEKSTDIKLHEQAGAMLDTFSSSVRDAQKHAHESGVDYTFTSNGIRYTAKPNGEIEKHTTENGL